MDYTYIRLYYILLDKYQNFPNIKKKEVYFIEFKSFLSKIFYSYYPCFSSFYLRINCYF